MESIKNGEVIRLRPCLSTYLVFEGPWILIIVLFLHLLYMRGTGTGALNVILFFSALLVFIHIWVRNHVIELSQSEVCYRTLFRVKCIPTTEVKRYFFDSRELSRWEQMQSKGFIRLVIQSRNKDTKPIEINIKLFSLGDIHKLEDYLSLFVSVR